MRSTVAAKKNVNWRKGMGAPSTSTSAPVAWKTARALWVPLSAERIRRVRSRDAWKTPCCSRATSWIAGSDSVTRTAPSPPTISASRRTRSAPPSRFARACGLMMTPMPSTLSRGARRGELPAGGLDVLAPALADGRVHAVVAQDRLEAHDPLPRARGETRPRERVERDQVHLGAEPVQQPHETARVGLAVVRAARHARP